MKLVSEIQHYRQRTNQAITLAAIVEDAIQCHYNRLDWSMRMPSKTTDDSTYPL